MVRKLMTMYEVKPQQYLCIGLCLKDVELSLIADSAAVDGLISVLP